MICFYNKNETDFSHNGLGVLDNHIVNPVVTEELNGLFSLEFDYPIHAPHADGLLQERIVKCPVPEMPPQLFRISERESTIGGLFHVVAYHIFYDLAQNLIEDTFVVNRNGQGAVTQILGASQFPHPFTGSSNISAVNSARIVRFNIAEILLDGGIENGFPARWGGEIIRNNFRIAMQTVRGSDNGVCIRDRKNLTGYRSNVDFGTVVTRIMPQGYDGLLLPEKYVDSPLIGNYHTPRIRVIKYDSVKAAVGERSDDEDAVPLPEAYNLLRSLAAKEYSDNKIDTPTATYDVEFAPLERTEEYKNFSVLETISIGDTVRVVHEEDGLDISARMVGYKYNPLTESYITVTLGNYTPKFTDIVKDIKRIEAGVSQASEDANFALLAANGKNTNYYGSETPDNPNKGDVWFKDNGDMLEMWIYEEREGETQWFPLVTDLTQEQIRQELKEAKTAVEEAKTKSEEAKTAGQAAETAAVQAKTESQNAVIKANQAFDLADTAVIKIGTPFMVSKWERGTINANGADVDSDSDLRSGLISVKPGETYIAQYTDGEEALTAHYHFYCENSAPEYTDFVPAVKQFSEWYTTGLYPTYSSIIPDLNARNFESMNITETPYLNSYTGNGDLLVVYRIALIGNPAPKVIHWLGRKDESDNAVFLLSNGVWTQIGMVTEGGTNIIHEWVLTENQRKGITSGNIHIAFFAIKQGSWAGNYLESTTPFTFNPQGSMKGELEHISAVSSSDAVTIPPDTAKMRVRISTESLPHEFLGNVYPAEERKDYRQAVYSAILHQNNLINLRVSEGGIINQINLSTEGILISGNKVHITGQTAIDNAVISTAMIADAAITNAKIATLDAGKINTGTLSADRIAAGSITSEKLTVANGFITNAMIANATIQSAKIAAIDAAKITTGTLAAARIAAGSITADKLATNALQVGFEGWNNSIRISPTQIDWYDGSSLQGRIQADGLYIYNGSAHIGTFAGSYAAENSAIRGISMHLSGSGSFISWGYRTGSSGNYSTVLVLDPQAKVRSQAGFHLGIDLCTNGYNFRTSGNRILKMTDLSLTTGGVALGTFPAWGGDNGRARVCFGTDHLYLVSNNVFCTVTAVTARITELITRVNQLITRLNNGWMITSSTYYSNTGLQTMGTSITVP